MEGNTRSSSTVRTIPVITLLSDLGTGHPAIGATRVLLTNAHPDTGIVDISHRITPYSIQQAAYMVQYACHHFPPHTVHLLLMDIVLGERHRMLLLKADAHYFIAPDNGILSLGLGKNNYPVWLCKEFSGPVSVLQWAEYAATVMDVLHNEQDLNERFSQFMIKEVAPLAVQQPIGARLDCSILQTDRFGNVTIGLSREQFDELIQDGPFSVKLPRQKELNKLSKHYSDVAPGQPLCRFNSMGYMEIAVNRGSATDVFEFGVATDKGINYSTITVNF